MKYPKNPILMCKRKCKFRLIKLDYMCVVFFVQYDTDLMHACDGLNMGVIIVPVNSNFLIKVYDTNRTPKGSTHAESFLSCIKPLMELS